MRTQGPASRGPLAYVLLNPRVRMLAAQMMMKLCDLGAALHALRFHFFGGHYRDAKIRPTHDQTERSGLAVEA